MRKRTDTDWSKHIVEAETAGDFATIHRLRIPDSIHLMVEFINMHDRGLLVRGDFGSWVFSQCFHPSRDGYVMDGYWLEKLHIANNMQCANEFSNVALDAEICDLIEYSKEVGRYEETKELIENLRICVSREEAVSLWNHAPNWMDPEDLPNGLDICDRVKIIFDAFDEICRRIKGNSDETRD